MTRSTIVLASVVLVSVVISLSGCVSGHSSIGPVTDARRVQMPGALQHVVLVDLADDAEIAAMKAASDELLPQIPLVRGYICGTPVDIGRANVADDYDLGIVVQFASVEDYKAYLDHPLHKQLVTEWRPKWRRSYIVDFGM